MLKLPAVMSDPMFPDPSCDVTRIRPWVVVVLFVVQLHLPEPAGTPVHKAQIDETAKMVMAKHERARFRFIRASGPRGCRG